MTTEERIVLTPEEAIAMLPEGELVHTFRNPSPGAMFGSDWSRASIEEEIRNAAYRELAGPIMTDMGHGLVLFPKSAKYQGDLLFVATKRSET